MNWERATVSAPPAPDKRGPFSWTCPQNASNSQVALSPYFSFVPSFIYRKGSKEVTDAEWKGQLLLRNRPLFPIDPTDLSRSTSLFLIFYSTLLSSLSLLLFRMRDPIVLTYVSGSLPVVSFLSLSYLQQSQDGCNVIPGQGEVFAQVEPILWNEKSSWTVSPTTAF